MSTILNTVVSYEDQVIDLVKKAQAPVIEYVAKGVDIAGDRLPDVTYPASLPTPIEVFETQVAFAKKLADVNAAFVTTVLETVAPVAGYAKPKQATRSTRSTKSTKAA